METTTSPTVDPKLNAEPQTPLLRTPNRDEIGLNWHRTGLPLRFFKRWIIQVFHSYCLSPFSEQLFPSKAQTCRWCGVQWTELDWAATAAWFGDARSGLQSSISLEEEDFDFGPHTWRLRGLVTRLCRGLFEGQPRLENI